MLLLLFLIYLFLYVCIYIYVSVYLILNEPPHQVYYTLMHIYTHTHMRMHQINEFIILVFFFTNNSFFDHQ